MIGDYETLASEVMRRHGVARPNLEFGPVNALNADDLLDAGKLLPARTRIAVISEEFMVYLRTAEKDAFLENVSSLLQGRGGALITSDVVVETRSLREANPLTPLAKSAKRDMRDFALRNDAEAASFIRLRDLRQPLLSRPLR